MRLPRWLVPIATALLLAWLYWPAVVELVRAWYTDPTFSHGFLVVPVALLLAAGRLPLPVAKRPATVAGSLLVAAGMALYLLAAAGDVRFLSPVSLLVTLYGLGLAALGWPAMRAVLFPYLFLYFAVPWPDLLVGHLSFPMQYLAASLAAMAAGLAGLPVVRTGVDLHLPTFSFTVAAPCSGMRSLIALLAFATLLAYLAQGSRGRRLALFACGLPVALWANATRITLILLIAQRWGAKTAEGFFHEFSGLLLFALAVGVLFGIGSLLRLRLGSLPRPHWAPLTGGPRGALGAPLALLAVGLAGSLWLSSAGRLAAPAFDLGQVPRQLGQWRGEDNPPFDESTLRVLQADAYLSRDYRAGQEVVQLVAVYGHRKETFHSPEFCLLGGGLNTAARGQSRLPAGGRANWSLLSKGRAYYIVLYYFLAGPTATDSLVTQQWRMLEARLAGRPVGGALIRYLAPVRRDPEETLSVVENMAAQFHPHLLGSVGF